MTVHLTILAWKIPWTEEAGGLQSMGLQRVRHDSATEQQNFCLVFKRGWGFPGGSDGKASACNAETWVQSLGWEDPLEKEMEAHSSTLAWKIP